MSNLDKAKPGVSVVIGGQERQLVFDWWALGLIEEERGNDFLRSIQGRLSIPQLFFLTWAALVNDNPNLDGSTPEKRRRAQRRVVDWCSNGTDIEELTNAVNQALLSSAPVIEAGRKSGAEKNAEKEKSTK